MKKCAICCEKKRNLYNICTRCRGQEDKAQCYKCLSSQLKMGSNDQLIIQCAFCRFYIPNDIKFQSSFYFLQKASALRKERLLTRELDREILLQQIAHLKSRLEVNKRRENLRIARRRRRQRRLYEDYPNNSSDEEEIDDSEVVPHPDLPSAFTDILALFQVPAPPLTPT